MLRLRSILPFLIAIAFITFFILSATWLACRTGGAGAVARIEQQLRDGSVTFPPNYYRNVETGFHTYDDCLTLLIAASSHNTFTDALTHAYYHVRKITPCYELDKELETPTQPQEDYWRYWWGSSTLAKMAIDAGISLKDIRIGLLCASYVVVLFGALCVALRHGQSGFFLVPLLFALLFGYGLPLYGQSLAHAPSLIVGMLGVSLYVLFKIVRQPLPVQCAYAFGLGGIVFYFDIMAGNIVVVMMCLGLAVLAGNRQLKMPLLAMGAFTTGALFSLAFRILIRSALLAQNPLAAAGEWIEQLSRRMAGHWQEFPYHTPIDVLNYFAFNIDMGTWPYLGRMSVFFLYLSAIIFYFVIVLRFALRRKKASPEMRQTCLALILIAAMVPVWYAVFFNHFLVHFWMTGRLLSIFAAVMVMLILVSNEERRKLRHHSQ